MSAEDISILDDQPESCAEFFNFNIYSEAISGIIQKKDTKTPLVIGIYGDWGSGKTSLMRTVETKVSDFDSINDPENPCLKKKKKKNGNEEDINVKTIWFNAWKYDKEDILWRALIMRILEELKIPETHIKPKHTSIHTIQSLPSTIIKRLKSPQFYLDDIDDFETLFSKIINTNNPLSEYISKQLEKNNILESYKGYGPREKSDVKAFIKGLNSLLEDPALFNKKRFSKVHLTEGTFQEAHELEKLKRRDLVKLNRKLLSEAYLNEKSWKENLNKKIDDLQNSLYQDVNREEPGNLEFKPGKFFAKIFGGSVKTGLSTLNPSILPDALKEFSESVQRTKTIIHVQKIQFKEQFQYRFEEIINTYYCKRNKRVVIFIDDLDRCLPEKALEILEAIKTFMDVEGCIFIIGIDKRVISYIVRQKYKNYDEKGESVEDLVFLNGENYLEKIIQLSFQLPPIEKDDLDDFIHELTDTDEEFYDKYFDIIKAGTKPNPRKVKRLINLIEFQRKIAGELVKNKILSEGDAKIYDSLTVLWAIITGNHTSVMEAVIKDEKRSNFVDIILHLVQPKEGDNLDELISPMGISDIDKNALTFLLASFKQYIISNWRDFDEIRIENIIRQVISHGQGEVKPEKGEVKTIESEDKITEREVETKESEDKTTELDKIILAIKNKKNFKGADLTILKNNKEKLNFSNMDLEGADLTGAKLEGAKFVRTKMNYAKLEGADLTNAKLNNAKLWYAKLRGAHLNNASLKDSEFFSADLSNADLSGADLYNAGLMSTHLENATFKNARLIQVNLRNAHFDEKTCFCTDEIDSITIDNLKGANMGDTKLWKPEKWNDIIDKYPEMKNKTDVIEECKCFDKKVSTQNTSQNH